METKLQQLTRHLEEMVALEKEVSSIGLPTGPMQKEIRLLQEEVRENSLLADDFDIFTGETLKDEPEVEVTELYSRKYKLTFVTGGNVTTATAYTASHEMRGMKRVKTSKMSPLKASQLIGSLILEGEYSHQCPHALGDDGRCLACGHTIY